MSRAVLLGLGAFLGLVLFEAFSRDGISALELGRAVLAAVVATLAAAAVRRSPPRRHT